jgi:HSP20 family protein
MLITIKGVERGLGLWEPLHNLQSMQDEMDRLFPTFWPKTQGDATNGDSAWRPSLEVYEESDKVVVKAEIPGVKKENISISLTDDVLTIKGERKFEHEEKMENYLLFEGSYGSFHRMLQIPQPVKADAVKAEYKDGILEIQLPKAEESKTREIKITVK